MAAATTSLPETPGGERNWDYRYTWIRDTAKTLWALNALGLDWEANDFFRFVADVAEAENGDLQLMYGVDGERALPETTLDHLAGYEGARPVRVGNAAYNQRQHDVWGAMVRAIDLHTGPHHRVEDRLWRIVQAQVQRALEHWREPDQGIWEVRSGPQHFTSSKVACWVAADAGARIAEVRGEDELAARWRAAAEEIRADVLANAVDERGVFTQHYDTKALDASVLLIPLFGFLPPSDERVRNTVLAIADELTEDEMVLRYRVDETDDGLSGEEGTFTICSFWLVSALVEIGELARAKTVREAAVLGKQPRALRRGDRPAQRTAPRQLPAGVHPPGADQRGHRCDRGGAGARHRQLTEPAKQGITMRLSTRNQLTGTITEVNIGSVMATVKVRLDGGDQTVTSSITKEADSTWNWRLARPRWCSSSRPTS